MRDRRSRRNFQAAAGGVLLASVLAASARGLEPQAASGSGQSQPSPSRRGTGTFTGLHLRTHPDHDLAGTRVYLARADEIVLDDGTAVADWRGQQADITVAGAGGLDTGTRQAGAWYEVYAIRRSGDGARSLLLHRAKDYYRDYRRADLAGGERLTGSDQPGLAQQFQVTTAGAVEFVDVAIAGSGAVNGRVWVTLASAGSDGTPGEPLAESDKLDAGRLASRPGFVRFIFRRPASLAASTPYNVVLNGVSDAGGAGAMVWAGSKTAGPATGAARRFDGATWQPAASIADFALAVHVTRNDNPVVMPAGYDQKAKIGFVFANREGRLAGFVAKDRLVMPLEGASNQVGNTDPVLFDLGSYIPPGVVRVELAMANEVAGIRVVALPVPQGYDATTGFTRAQGGQTSAVPFVRSQSPSTMAGSIITEYQACYFYTTGDGNARASVTLWEW